MYTPTQETDHTSEHIIAWATDTHLDFLSTQERAYIQWINSIKESSAQALLLTGDIANAHTLTPWLKQIASELPLPIYFVLGNHDYYGGKISSVRQQLSTLNTPPLIWLGSGALVHLSAETALIGHGGWGDARIGDFLSTPVRINDHRQIEELTGHERPTLQEKLHTLGTDAAEVLQRALNQTLTPHRYSTVIIATHVPPFRESTWYQGRYGDIDWMPDFCCAATGEVIRAHALAHPQQKINVYCGHTHGEGRFRALSNLDVFTGKAEYGHPAIQDFIKVSDGAPLTIERYSTSP